MTAAIDRLRGAAEAERTLPYSAEVTVIQEDLKKAMAIVEVVLEDHRSCPLRCEYHRLLNALEMER